MLQQEKFMNQNKKDKSGEMPKLLSFLFLCSPAKQPFFSVRPAEKPVDSNFFVSF
nr:hypothetical protein [Bacillus subtilis]